MARELNEKEQSLLRKLFQCVSKYCTAHGIALACNEYGDIVAAHTEGELRVGDSDDDDVSAVFSPVAQGVATPFSSSFDTLVEVKTEPKQET